MIFVDSNIPMYLVGGSHPNKTNAQRLVESLVEQRERLITDAEVLQEILHRFIAINRLDAVQPAFDALLRITDDVLSIDKRAVERAKEMVMGTPRLSARDAVHLAIMEHNNINRILSFDQGFDAFPGITRLT